VDKPARGRVSRLPPQLVDGRSRRVVVLSHCLLNQNTRYPGGAVCPGAVPAVLQPYLDDEAGLVQMPCPEQRSWGGVRRPPVLWALAHRRATALVPLVLPVIERYLRWRYARLARTVARDVADAARAGVDVVAVVGVAGSPSCGVRTTLDLGAAARRVARSDHDLTQAWLTDEVVAASEQPGQGLFTTALQDQLARRHLDVPFTEHRLPGPGDRRTR
jgi:uncharacterized protein YbbK (DUF523 family)